MKMSPLVQLPTYQDLDLAPLKNVWKKTFEKMKAQANSPETATDFYLDVKHEIKGKPSIFFVAGKQKTEWKKHAKDKLKKDKKHKMVGKCYVEQDENGAWVLKLQPKVGNAKLNITNKFAKKYFKNVARVELCTAQKEEAPTTENQDQPTATRSAVPKEGEEETTVNSKGKMGPIGAIAKQYQQFWKKIVNDIEPLAKEEGAKFSPKDFKITNKASELSQQFLKEYESASEEVQEKLSKFKTNLEGRIDKIKNLLPKIKANLKGKSTTKVTQEDVNKVRELLGGVLKAFNELRKLD